MIFLFKSAQLKTQTNFTRAIYSISHLKRSLNKRLIYVSAFTFTEIYIQASTPCYFDCSPMCIIHSSCNISYFRGHYFQIPHFLSNFFWKLEFFHHLHLFYITYLLILKWISTFIITIAITVSLSKAYDIKDFPKYNVWSKFMVHWKILQCWRI